MLSVTSVPSRTSPSCVLRWRGDAADLICGFRQGVRRPQNSGASQPPRRKEQDLGPSLLRGSAQRRPALKVDASGIRRSIRGLDRTSNGSLPPMVRHFTEHRPMEAVPRFTRDVVGLVALALQRSRLNGSDRVSPKWKGCGRTRLLGSFISAIFPAVTPRLHFNAEIA